MPRLQKLRTCADWGLLLLFAAGPQSQAPVPVTAAVTDVVDGDTFKVRVGAVEDEVRVFGVDAPEGPQKFGQDAKRFAERWLPGRTVWLLPRGKDRGGRLVASVRVSGKDFGAELVGAGYAWHYVTFAPRETELAAREREARRAGRGLWRDNAPQPPWEFRNSAPPPTGRASVAFRGNQNSRVFHAPGCRDYDCKNCVVPFKTIDEARSRDFRPHSACVR